MKESVVLSFIILAIWPFVHSHIVFFHLTGALKEVRETPSKPQHKLVEFFDTRDAARALAELNGKEINGRRLLLEFGRPGSGQVRSPADGHKQVELPRGHPPRPRFPEQTVVPKKTSANTAPAAVTRRRGSNSSGGRKAKSSGSSNRPSSSSSPPQPQPQPQQQQQSSGGSRRSWKHRNKSGSSESRFLFKEVESEESSESSCRDSRTTVMIKNIPNKCRSFYIHMISIGYLHASFSFLHSVLFLSPECSQKLLLNMLDNHCIQCNEQIREGADDPYSAYDFVYLPIDFK
ncbi:hypothetical protein GW17_00047719 [Ensete ventricosum]|nr:hypothetical protein GW17_00047719 [Ensete ventricosum]